MFVWIVFIVLLPLLPLLIVFDIVLHWSLNVPIVFPWQVDLALNNDTNTGDTLLTTTTIKNTDDGDVYNDNSTDYGGTKAAGTDNDDTINGGGSADRRRKTRTRTRTTRARARAREGTSKGKKISFDEIIDVRSPSENKWFRIDRCINVPFDTDVLSWEKTKKELGQCTSGTAAGSLRESQQKQQHLKEEQKHEKLQIGHDDDDDDKNVFASENSQLKQPTLLNPQPKNPKNVLLVCMSGHRSPLMAYFLKRKGVCDHDHINNNGEKDDEDKNEAKNDVTKNSSKKNDKDNSNSITKTTASTTTYYNLYGGMIFWKLCGKEVTYG